MLFITFMAVGATETEESKGKDFNELRSSMASLQAELASVKARTITACRICFQETEGSSQCQGHRHSCSGWSIHPEWTLPFRDDTDNRPGGCFYQWKLECLKGI
ncbi:unnamed protein product [Rotaria magnacalcarata]|uniref:Uncharacterized protein n=3 Tax=Rotaria magnacalcarata TaxID=392030 RepID=A0A816SNN7_9BILA|nr:unnamed protein product [Rotaria magnacalcarata]CAF2087233.1 unnamed protein product [Rotaria magnacalcarata]CAF2108056.1 unnamed protein product [Rotaria magnacalcarata]